MSQAELHENPLVPNRKLRQIYLAMVEARLLTEYAARNKSNKMHRRFISTRGEEACRVSTAIDMMPGDLVSDSEPGPIMNLLAGIPVETLLRRLRDKAAEAQPIEGSLQLPWIEDPSDRLKLAMGAAFSLKAQKDGHIVLAYVRGGEMGKDEWRRALELAATLELPIFFVVLAGDADLGKKRKSRLTRQARSCGVPGIVVDAQDAVALYRVSQETLGRLRGGGGPVLIECVPYEVKGLHGEAQSDGVLQMKQFLLGRKIASKTWLENAGDAMRRKIVATRT